MKCIKLFIFIMFILACLSSQAGSAEKKRVAIIRYPLPPMNFSDVILSFKKVMETNGYTEGKNIEYIDLLTDTDDKASIPQVNEFTLAHKDKADLFLTCGWVSMYARKILKGSDTPQIFTFVLRRVAHKLVPSLETGSGCNIAGIYLIYPPEKILRLLKLTLPQAKKYGVCWNSNVPADVFFKLSFEELANTMDIEIVYFDLALGVDTIMEQIKNSHVDAFGGCVSFRKPRFAKLFTLPIPVISPKLNNENPDDMRDTNEITGFWNSSGGELAARMALDIWNGKTTIDKIIPQRIKTQIIYVNKGNAERMDIKISPILFKIADEIYR